MVHFLELDRVSKTFGINGGAVGAEGLADVLDLQEMRHLGHVRYTKQRRCSQRIAWSLTSPMIPMVRMPPKMTSLFT